MASVEISVEALLDGGRRQDETGHLVRYADQALRCGQDVMIYTFRALRPSVSFVFQNSLRNPNTRFVLPDVVSHNWMEYNGRGEKWLGSIQRMKLEA